MPDGFEIVDAQAGQRFLKQLPPQSRRKGESLFRSGRVQELSQQAPGMTFTSVVQDNGPKNVYLQYDPEGGWEGDCDCIDEFDCPHVFAAMSALLAEHRTSVVRNLSAGISPRTSGMLPGFPVDPNVHQLKERLAAVTGRPLTREENDFLNRVHKVFLRCRQNRRINYFDFQDMGLPIFDGDWNPPSIWPSLPATEHEFWLYVANSLRERN